MSQFNLLMQTGRGSTRRIFTIAIATLTVSVAYSLRPTTALGQFGRVANQPWSGGITVKNAVKTPKVDVPISEISKKDILVSQVHLKNKAGGPPAPTAPKTASVNLMPIMNAKWQAARTQLIADTQTYLNEKNIGGGWRTSKNRLNLANSGPLFVGNDGSGFTIRFQLPGNSLNTWLRTPTGVSEAADPGFQVTFDLDVTINVDVRGNRLVAGPAQIKANVQQPVGTNATGKAALAAAKIVKSFLGGPDFIGKLLSTVNNRQFSFDTGINQELAKFNPLLDKAAGVGAIVPGYDPASQSITVTLVNASKGPVVN